MIHVAVVHSPYLDAILAGHKTIESRLSKVRCDPFGVIFTGERLYFKARSGAVLATAVADQVLSFNDLSPKRIAALRREFGPAIDAQPDYWKAKQTARFATLITLTEVEHVRFGPRFPAFYGRAWQRLPDAACVYPRCLDNEKHAASA